MEDNLKKMEDDLKRIKMEDDLNKNGRRPKQNKKWKTTSNKNGRRPQAQLKNQP